MSITGEKMNDALVINLEGRLDSSNASDVEKEVFNLIQNNPTDYIIFEAKNLEYISSAGLRVLLKVIQSSKEKVVMQNVNSTVGDILHMTGFNTLMKVTKAMREFSVEGCEVIGRGGNGIVYRLDEDTIIKVYYENTPIEAIEKERNLAQNAFLAGVPTAISYDIVKVDNLYGIVFEMIKAETFSSLMKKEPEKYALEYAKLLKKIHSTKADPTKFISTKDIYKGFVDKLGDRLTPEEASRLKKFIDDIPDRDTILHGDYHPSNVMLQNGEPILIDMADLGYGHPIFDIAGTYVLLVQCAKSNPETLKYYLGMEPETALKVWDVFVKTYFETEDPERLAMIDQILSGYAMLRTTIGTMQANTLPEEQIQASLQIGRAYFFPNMDKITGTVNFLGI